MGVIYTLSVGCEATDSGVTEVTGIVGVVDAMGGTTCRPCKRSTWEEDFAMEEG